MKKLNKIMIAILGGCNKVMNLFIPIAVALLFINTTGLNELSATVLLIVAMASTLFRGIKETLI